MKKQIHHITQMLQALVLMLCISSTVRAEDTSYAFGEWNIYNATPESTQIEVFADRLYIVNATALSSIDLDLNPDSQESYNRKDGLSGVTVQEILASPQAGKLAIAYTDGAIDLLDADGTIHCIPDLASKPISGDKTIYSLRESQGMLYVSGGFGLLVIDMQRNMIVQHYASKYPILFAAEHEGIIYRYSAKQRLEYLESGKNGNDPDNWQQLKEAPVLTDIRAFATDGGSAHLFAITQKGELITIGREGTKVIDSTHNLRRIHRVNNLLMLQGDVLLLFDPEQNTFTANNSLPYINCNGFSASNDDSCYMLHSYYGLFETRYVNYEAGKSLTLEADYNTGRQPNGIATAYLGRMHLTDTGVVGISRRSYVMGLSDANALAGVLSYLDIEEEKATNIVTRDLQKQLSANTSFQALQGFDIDPTKNDRYAICSGLYGLFIMEGDTIAELLDGKNSIGKIDAFDPNFASTRVSAVAYDDDGNLFVANSMQDTLLRCRTAEGKWLKFPNADMAKLQDASRILISRHGNNHYKWVLNDCFYRKSRIGIYDDNGTLTTQSDDQVTSFSTLVDQDGNGWEPDYIYDLCEDLDGKIWVLTNLGPFVIEDPTATFRYAQGNQGRGKVRRVKIPRNDGTNLADYLMESTSCSCMVIDNFNRKWIGTYGAGLYLMSADCITEIEHFDTDNSPLLSSSILDLCYDAHSGLLYISCEGGVLTYQTDAIEGADDFNNIYCYPNPVRPEYGGELRIMGLMNDSQVSITTTNGNLIYRTRSQGATATWDLRTAEGARVEPGVYVIHGVDSEGKKGSVCRFLVL